MRVLSSLSYGQSGNSITSDQQTLCHRIFDVTADTFQLDAASGRSQTRFDCLRRNEPAPRHAANGKGTPGSFERTLGDAACSLRSPSLRSDGWCTTRQLSCSCCDDIGWGRCSSAGSCFP